MFNESNNEIEIIVGNFNSDRRVSPSAPQGKTIAQAFSEYQTPRRISTLYSMIDKLKTNVIMILVEIDAETKQSLTDYCAKNHVAITTFAYNKSVGCFHFVIMTKNPSLINSIKCFPLTKSGSYVENVTRPAGPVVSKPGEKPTTEFLLYQEEICFDNFEKSLIQIALGKLHVYATHVGLSNKAKITQTQLIANIVQKQSIVNQNQVIVTGDFNCFNAEKTGNVLLTEQLDHLNFLKWSTANIKSTFKSYPFDIVYKLSATEKQTYFKLIDEVQIDQFRTFCEQMAMTYGLEGGALDQVFATTDLAIEQIEMYPASDHSFFSIKVPIDITY